MHDRKLGHTLVTGLLAALAMTMGTGSASAAPQSGPLGPPVDLDVSKAAQATVASGGTLAAGAVVCAATAGTSCPAVIPLVTSIVSSYLASATPCPGVRRFTVQAYSVPPSPHAVPDGQTFKILSSTCI